MTSSFALIGVGGIGGYHLESLRRLEKRGLVHLAAVADPMVERFPELKRELGLRGVRWYLDYRELLRGEEHLDAVTIATPIPFHSEMTMACLERGVFVNLEKPPVPLVQQLESLIRADAHRKVTVGFQMVLSRCVQRMKAAIIGGEIGDVRSIRAAGCWPRRDPYYQRASWAGKMVLDGQPVFDGPATNALAHLVHNIMFLAGSTARECAIPTDVQGELYRARPIESYDVACMRGEFSGGIDFSLAVTHATREAVPFKLEVRGSKGWLRLSNDGATLQTTSGDRMRCADTTQELLNLCYDRFLNVISNGDQPTYASLKDTRGYVRATNGLLLSSGGIHDIDAQWVRQYDKSGEAGYDVLDLPLAIERTFSEGLLFSEQGVGWASARPIIVRLDSLHNVGLSMTPMSSAA